MRRNKKGFTIVELVIVIAIIGVLAAVLIPTFINLTSKAQEASDQSLVANLNKALKMEEQQLGHKKSETLQGAVNDLYEQGYVLENIVAKSGKDLLWDQVDNQFLLNEGDSHTGARYWQIVKDIPSNGSQKYSYYAGKQFNAASTTNELKYGFDAGENDNITSLTYTGVGSKQTVAIRTNGGTLVIDAGDDVVKHFGGAEVVTLSSVGTESYYENGTVDQVNLKRGRLVLTNEERASVGTVRLQATNDSYDNIVIATQQGAELPNLIARDTVSLPEGSDTKKVVTIQTNVDKEGKQPEKTEVINLYSTKGSTGNDVYEATNGYDVSSLGLLVVEASSDGKKAQAAEQISDPAVVEKVSEPKSAVEVDTQGKLKNALDAKAKFIVVTASFDTTIAFLITGSTIIEGAQLEDGSYPVITSKATAQSEKRGFRINTSNVEVTLRNLTVDVRSSVVSDGGNPRGVQVDSNKVGVKLTVDNCNISATHYAFNVCDGAEVEAKFINSHLLGYGSLNLWHASYLVSVDNCTLEGIQNSNESFGIIVLEGDTTGETSLHSSAITVQITNSKLIGTCNAENGKMAFVGFNTGATANAVRFTNCTFEKHGVGIVRAEYDLGTANKVLLDDKSYSEYYNAIDNNILYKYGFDEDYHTVIAKTVYRSDYFDTWNECLAEIMTRDLDKIVNAYVTKQGKYYYTYIID